MRHWEPRIADTLERMSREGIREAVAIVMAPHNSSMSTGRYWAALAEAQRGISRPIPTVCVDSWWRNRRFLDAQVSCTRAALPRPRAGGGGVHVLFTAHSLPARILELGDPYPDEVRGHAQALSHRLGLKAWTLCYQSAPNTGEPWLGPQIGETLADLSSRGCQDVLVSPLGFVCDNIEVLYDIDVAARETASDLGIRLTRTRSLNADPGLIRALADTVLQASAAPRGGPPEQAAAEPHFHWEYA